MTKSMHHKDYLLNQQYRNAANLQARIALHQQFSRNPNNWHRWVFDQWELPAQANVLELGAGAGHLWFENRDRIPADWRITLSDFSQGMLDEAQQRLAGVPGDFAFEHIDVQAIPYADASFDVVIANHMLYHVPDLTKALAEIRRVLRPDGRFYATTTGVAHLNEVFALAQRFNIPYMFAKHETPSFSLENGLALLSRSFVHSEMRRFDDGLVVTEVEPLVAFVRSGHLGDDPTEAAYDALTQWLQQEIAERGSVAITKDSGLFITW